MALDRTDDLVLTGRRCRERKGLGVAGLDFFFPIDEVGEEFFLGGRQIGLARPLCSRYIVARGRRSRTMVMNCGKFCVEWPWT